MKDLEMTNLKNNTRDLHSPANITPEAYAYVGTFYQGPCSKALLEAEGYDTSDEGIAESWADFSNAALQNRVKTSGGYVGNWNDRGTCDHCGAAFLYGQVFEHTASGDLVAVGNICGENTFGADDRATLDFTRLQSRVAAGKLREKMLVEADAFYDANEGLREALALGAAKSEQFETRTLADLRSKLNKYGSLSDKQIAFAHSLADAVGTGETQAKRLDDADARQAKADEERAAKLATAEKWTAGRQVIEGVILGVKEADPYATFPADKMLVELADGRRVWGSVSGSLSEAVEVLKDLRGRTVTLRGTITPSDRDAYFAFFNRPSNAVLGDSK